MCKFSNLRTAVAQQRVSEAKQHLHSISPPVDCEGILALTAPLSEEEGHVAGGVVISAARGGFFIRKVRGLTGHVAAGGGGETRFVYRTSSSVCLPRAGVPFQHSITGQTGEVPGTPRGLSLPSHSITSSIIASSFTKDQTLTITKKMELMLRSASFPRRASSG